MVYVFLTEGFEEIEAITTIDLLRRADIDTTTVATGTERLVKGSHGVSVQADVLLDDFEKDYENADMLVLPGGGGVFKLEGNKRLSAIFNKNSKTKVAGICAAPMVLASFGLVDGVKYTCFPSVAQKIKGELVEKGAVTDGKLTTGRAAGTSIDFALELVKVLKGETARNNLAAEILYEEREQ